MNIYQYLHGKKHFSSINASRITLLISMVLWFVIGGLIGALLGIIQPDKMLSFILNIGSLFSIVIGFMIQMIVILRVSEENR